MKKMIRLSSVLLLAAVLSLVMVAPVSASVYFDGVGSPADHGYTGLGGFATLFDLDTPSAGYMHQDADYAGDGQWDLDNAATELVRATGWEFTIRVESVSVIDTGGFNYGNGGRVFIRDDVGYINAVYRPEAFWIKRGIAGPVLLDVAVTQGYNTLKLDMAPGGTSVDVYVNGSYEGSVATEASTGPELRIGDTTSTEGVECNYDYFNLVPEPVTLTLLSASGLLALLSRRRRAS